MSPTDDLWVEPTQARSRAKVSKILETATEMVVESGSLDLKMREVARRAGVAIGTLYQFFPSRTALVGRLFAAAMAPVDESLGAALATADSMAALGARVEALLFEQLALVRNRPELLVIWGSAAVDPAIQAADLAHTRANARRLADALEALLGPEGDAATIHATALLVCHLWSSVIRLAVQSPEDEGETLIRTYGAMIAAHGARLARG